MRCVWHDYKQGAEDFANGSPAAKAAYWVIATPPLIQNMIAALKKAGGNPKYTEYPDEGHGSWGPAYRDPELFKWLFAQKKE